MDWIKELKCDNLKWKRDIDMIVDSSKNRQLHIAEVSELIRFIIKYKCVSGKSLHEETAALPLQNVNISFSEGDIVEFTPCRGEPRRGYITMHCGTLNIRCPHPHYEYHPIYPNTIMIKKGGWEN